MKTLFRLLFPILVGSMLLSACSGASPFAMATATPTATATATQTAAATVTPTLTPTPIRTPPALPAIFTSSTYILKDAPHTYVADTCTYLKDRWDPNKSTPGTIVMPVMFHSITEGAVALDNQISAFDFQQLMRDIHEQGFESITAEELADFMESNARIPKRSVLLILDDRRPGAVRQHFLPILEEYDWTVTLGWLIGEGEDSTDKKPASPINGYPGDVFTSLWEQMEAYNQTGRLDVQAHGYNHNIPAGEYSSDDFLRNELEAPIPILEQHFGRKPIAYIWPGGGFTQRSVELAREAGYRLGFTVNPRGPLMYNWVPLGDTNDPMRPSYMPEGAIGDPLMVLPRYWDTDVRNYLDFIRVMGKEAAAAAEANKAIELEYYDIVCRPTYGEIPALEISEMDTATP
ncbi:MAG: polysaccharide deacetylase family protein [Anaerolineaceae bacterium]|nr:polysaccharide deacetylase family protein [Anaerolineaceae bacterium]